LGQLARRSVAVGAAVALGGLLTVAVAVALTPLPEALRGNDEVGAPRGGASVRYADRDGALLREVRADDATRARWAPLGAVGPRATLAVLAAEDRRFYEHPGVDVLALARAAFSSLFHGRVVSGASTLTMQLARLVHPAPRTLMGKLTQMRVALRIEASLSKRRILEEYLNRAPFGPAVRGIDAASHLYFDKPPAELSYAESAALAAIPRGPAVYTMAAHPERVVRRRDRILDRMLAAGAITDETHDRAKSEPLGTWVTRGSSGAPHLVAALSGGGLGVGDAADVGSIAWARREHVETVTTTIDRDLQREAEFAVRAALRPLAKWHVTAASVVVLDNASGDVLAYVGSPDFTDQHAGQTDGVRARRQPGSTLKPFVYGLAMERLGFTAATALPDIELHIPVDSGVYAPNNYDEHFHGPVRLREALANSLNVPAVWTASHLGARPLLERLHDAGFASLVEEPGYYGPGLALGDGEVTLLELANAYATLARGGVMRPVRAVRGASGAGGATVDLPEGAARRVMPEPIAAILTDILSDPHARVASFGEQSALELPFSVAAKTGTSKGFRDNWAVGFTREVTVGVWVGNFDGSPMEGVSGVTGAGPLFRSVMDAAMRSRPKEPLGLDSGRANAEGLVPVHVCPLSGGAATAACPHAVTEWAPRSHLPEPCTMHEVVAVDTRNGLRAGPGCDARFVESRVMEHLAAEYEAWAKDARRPVAPRAFSPLCPGPIEDAALTEPLQIAYPRDGARYLLEPGRPAEVQTVPVRVLSPAGREAVELYVDGRSAGVMRPPFVREWPLTKGEHVLVAQAGPGEASAAVRVVVE
jgi:penicillin-binding protein 1C